MHPLLQTPASVAFNSGQLRTLVLCIKPNDNTHSKGNPRKPPPKVTASIEDARHFLNTLFINDLDSKQMIINLDIEHVPVTELKVGAITLITKKGNCITALDNIRPITLLNYDYKILSSILVARLIPHLSHLTSHDQTGSRKRKITNF
eukprot:TRINITY_DN6461_c0_g2_i3.p3 TRINITY_DN6461_c0_g2~~TRINITY_DN6461_c0_g2_i3.p3  ORF type:complete len:148 (-),score=7.13 TRINITY_DN6461_c0_g2_i3:647-1090(-)